MSDPFSILVKEAARTGLPRYFQTDLTRHDRRVLAELGDNPCFIWVLRESGTHLLAFGTDGKDKSLGACRAAVLASAGDTTRLYYMFKDGELKPITYDGALRLVA